jgi:hypothetical protein
MALVRGHLSSGTTEAWPRDAPCAFPQDIKHFALHFDYGLPLV